jgi:hypothetical protein
MGQTRMFRDRVVSMEQTLEGGEKHLPLLKELCREALPDYEYRDHALDHERDLFVMDLQGPAGAARRIAWTRMVLFDAERIPTLTGDPAAELRRKIVEFIRAHGERPEIVVTFRHLEEGWVDTPEPRREGGGRRRRRGGRGGRGGERGGERVGERGGERRPGAPAGGPTGQRPQPPRPQGGPSRPQSPPRAAGGPRPPRPEGAPESAGTPAGGAAAAGAAEGSGKRRRRFRRRRRGGRGPGGGAGGPSPAGTGAPGRPE